MWSFFETVRHRHSIRRYQLERPVESEKLHAVLEAAMSAPSAGDLQSYRVIVVKDRSLLEALSHAAHEQTFVASAPVCLVFCADPARSEQRYGARGSSLYAIQDATIAAAYAQLAVVAEELGSTWVGSFDEEAVRSALSLEPTLVPIALLAVGYPAELPEATPRRRIDEIVTFR
jgi:nitroreductase